VIRRKQEEQAARVSLVPPGNGRGRRRRLGKVSAFASKFDQGLGSLPGQVAANLGVAHDGADIAEEFLDSRKSFPF